MHGYRLPEQPRHQKNIDNLSTNLLVRSRRKEQITKKVYLVHSPQGTSLPDPCVLLKSTCVIITVHKYMYTHKIPVCSQPLTCYCMFRRLVKNDTTSSSLSLIKHSDALPVAENLQVTFRKIPTKFCYPVLMQM